MSDPEESAGYDAETAGVDDPEILEVVGVDHEAAPPAADENGLAAEDDAGAFAADEGLDVSPGMTEDQEQLLRLRADYDNLRKRIERERQEFELQANFQIVGRLLPILDNFERALAVTAGGESDLAFREGCEMIYKQLIDELRRQGLRAIETEGQKFDPEVHDAVATDAISEEPPNTVLEELRRGYLFRNRLLRPAMVKVSTNGCDDSEPS
jgi:molecular chaperone GrpE